MGKNNSPRVTIKDIARKAHVSPGTVSRALNNSGYVGKETRQRIEEAISQTGYIPNASARNIIGKNSSLIGVIVPEIGNSFVGELVAEIESKLQEKSMITSLCSSNYNDRIVDKFAEELVCRNADGLILVSTKVSNPQTLSMIQERLNVVSLGSLNEGTSSVEWSETEITAKLIQHLIDLGHKKIACIGFHESAEQSMKRLESYKKCLLDNDIPLNDSYMLGVSRKELGSTGYVRTKQLLDLKEKERPTAIFAINDFYALQSYAAIHEFGLRVGKDISVVGFDDYKFSRFYNPALTTVRCPVESTVGYCVDLLMEQIEDSDTPTKHLQVKTEIILRDSVMRV